MIICKTNKQTRGQTDFFRDSTAMVFTKSSAKYMCIYIIVHSHREQTSRVIHDTLLRASGSPEDAREAVVVAYNREYKKKILTSSNSK